MIELHQFPRAFGLPNPSPPCMKVESYLRLAGLDYRIETLVNPAKAPNQVIGVFDSELVVPLAEVLQQMGSRHVMVVHADDGMDEISISCPTSVAELKDGQVNSYRIQPEDFVMASADIAETKVDGVAQSLAMIQSVCGQYLAVAGIELDYLFAGNFGAAVFVDASNADDSFPPDMKVGAGIGFRWRSPVGMLRIDVAHPFDDPSNDYRLHISIGPDL